MTGRKKLGRKRCTSNRDERKLKNNVKQSRFKHLGEVPKERTEVEGCIGFGLPRDPTQFLRERAVLPLLLQGVGGQKILRETRGEHWDLVVSIVSKCRFCYNSVKFQPLSLDQKLDSLFLQIKCHSAQSISSE